MSLPPGTLPLVAILMIDVAVVIAFALWWPPSLLILAGGVIVLLALICEGADQLFGRDPRRRHHL